MLNANEARKLMMVRSNSIYEEIKSEVYKNIENTAKRGQDEHYLNRKRGPKHIMDLLAAEFLNQGYGIGFVPASQVTDWQEQMVISWAEQEPNRRPDALPPSSNGSNY